MNTLQGSFTPSKKPQKKVIVDNPFEALKDVGTTAVDTVKESSQEAVKDMWAQIFGVDKYAAKPAAKQGGVLEKGKAQEIKSKESKSEAPVNYFKEIKEAGKAELQKEAAEIHQQIQAIMYELQRLAQSSKEIEKTVATAIGTGVISPGAYHLNFFEWMFSVVRDARKRVEHAGAWLSTVKRKKVIGFNKKNMSHLLSGERSVSQNS